MENEKQTETLWITPTTKNKILRLRAKLVLEKGENMTYDDALNVILDFYDTH